MTDQAEVQSGATSQDAAPAKEMTLTAMFDLALSGEQPEGQAPTEQGGEAVEAESGENPEVEGEQVAEPIPEKFKVPALEGDGFDELTAEEIKAQRLMQADYTRKTQEVAEQRKAIAAEREKALSTLSQRSQEAELYLQNLAGAIKTFDAQVDWDKLREVDPSAYLEARETQQRRMQAFNESRQYFEQVRNAEKAERVAQNSQRLIEAMPELLDSKAAKAFGERITEAANTHYGFTPDEVASVEDHRLILMMRDAAKYHDLVAKSAQVKATVAKAPQLAKPGAPKPGNSEALSTFKAIDMASKSKDKNDIAAAFDKFLSGAAKR